MENIMVLYFTNQRIAQESATVRKGSSAHFSSAVIWCTLRIKIRKISIQHKKELSHLTILTEENGLSLNISQQSNSRMLAFSLSADPRKTTDNLF